MKNHSSRYFNLSGTPLHSSASAGADFIAVIIGHFLDNFLFNSVNVFLSSGRSSSAKIASTGHSGTQRLQSIHSSGSMTSMFGPSQKQSTGQTSTQSPYLHRMHFSVTTNVIGFLSSRLDFRQL